MVHNSGLREAVRHMGNAIEALRLPTGTAGVLAQTFSDVAANTAYQFTLYGSANPALVVERGLPSA